FNLPTPVTGGAELRPQGLPTRFTGFSRPKTTILIVCLQSSDFKFHSKDRSLASTGTPVSLAPALSGNRRGRYHLLRIGGGVLN
ncbi:MAG TPA: hypothetical protein VJQ48_12965, partial [Candidatus Binatia bacterium]|nr:hypothetical protein [Candidatus Binatia bacterium]